jgi:hypothetical protein
MIHRLTTIGLLLVAGAACGDGPSSPPEVEVQEQTVAIQLEPSSLAFDALGDTVRMRAMRETNFGRVLEAPAAQWSSSGDTVVTVDFDGLVSSMGDGTAAVRATVEGLSAAASVVVRQTPDSVIVTPALNPVVVGSAIQFDARVLDRLGNDMTASTTLDWASLAPGVASVESPGRVSGVSIDTAVVEARAEDAVGTAEVHVVTQDWPNEPAGFTELTDQPWSALGSNGWGHQNRASFSHIISDPTAPFSGGSVLEHVYPEGYTDYGTEPAVEWINAGGAPKMYVGFWWKASENWHPHNSGINKILFFKNESSTANFVVTMRGGGPYSLDIDPENHPAQLGRADGGRGYMTPNVAPAPLVPGRWYRIEVLIDHVAGSIDWWLDGTLVGSYRGLELRDDGFGEFQIAPTWGGTSNAGTGPKRQDDYYRFDHLRISVGG